MGVSEFGVQVARINLKFILTHGSKRPVLPQISSSKSGHFIFSCFVLPPKASSPEPSYRRVLSRNTHFILRPQLLLNTLASYFKSKYFWKAIVLYCVSRKFQNYSRDSTGKFQCKREFAIFLQKSISRKAVKAFLIN